MAFLSDIYVKSIMLLVVWVSVGFVCGSIPWAVIVGKFLSHDDVRSVGDGNPGAVNAWKSGGWVPGMISMMLEIGKGFSYLLVFVTDDDPYVVAPNVMT